LREGTVLKKGRYCILFRPIIKISLMRCDFKVCYGCSLVWQSGVAIAEQVSAPTKWCYACRSGNLFRDCRGCQRL